MSAGDAVELLPGTKACADALTPSALACDASAVVTAEAVGFGNENSGAFTLNPEC